MRTVLPVFQHAVASFTSVRPSPSPVWLLSLSLVASLAQAQDAPPPLPQAPPLTELAAAPALAAPTVVDAAGVPDAPAPVAQESAMRSPAPAAAQEPAPASEPTQTQAAAPTSAPSAAPESPAVVGAPNPPTPPALAIVPLPPEQATERALGARCPVDLAGRLAAQGDLLIGACEGQMPAHLAAVLVALPEQDIHLPRSWREREVRQKVWFKAVPGFGQRSDFIARMGDIWVRSLEGRDAESTFYLVSAPFLCSNPAAGTTVQVQEPVRLPAGECREAYIAQRVYQVRGDAAPREVTAEVMPAMPPLTEADRARQLAREGRITLDHSKLQFGPAMRWFVQYPETAQKGGPRAFSDWSREHLAFVVWTGDRFELREKISRSQWPCDPVAPGDRACGGFPDSGPDLFVTAGTSVPMAASSP